MEIKTHDDFLEKILIPYVYKLDSIEESEFWADDFYDLNKFKKVVNTGLDKELLKAGMSFQDVKKILVCEYID